MPDRKWTVMLYMAGDSTLSARCIEDLRKLQTAHLQSGQVAVVAQVDQREPGIPVRRYHFPATKGNEGFDVVRVAAEVDMGQAETLEKFIEYCQEKYSAEHYILILWGHGGALDQTPMSDKEDTAFFKICTDETSGGSFISNLELVEVLKTQTSRRGQKLDLLVTDACQLSMVELCYELREWVGFTVGSQSFIQGMGLPYDVIMCALDDQPDLAPEQVCHLFVKTFADFYGNFFADEVQLSACDLSRLKPLTEQVRALTEAMMTALESSEITGQMMLNSLLEAQFTAQSFDTQNNYADLFDFCSMLHHACGDKFLSDSKNMVKEQCLAVMRAVDSKADAATEKQMGVVIANEYIGDSLAFSYGLSIYLPFQEKASERYETLAFAQNTRWHEFLILYYKKLNSKKRRSNQNRALVS